MKELSIEEKACYYDEAVINGSRLWECGKITRETYEYIFPELKESEDERIRGAILHFISHTPTVPKGLISKEDMIGWLEKQSEQEVNEPDWCHHKVDLSDCSEEYRKAYYDGWNNCNQQHSQCNAEQKPADKVESKFKVGDWVVSPNGVYWHIDAIQNGRYEVTADTGQCGNWPLDTNIYRLWTIQDAKNGDVLSDGTTIFIFKDLLSDGSVISYCDYDTDSGESDAFCPLSVNLICSKITPATKEQRDLLFEKMHEARYEWDAEKKELEKQGEQRAAWSEEDEKMIGRIRGIIEAYAFSQSAVDVNGDLCEKKFIDADIWLKSLKEKIGGLGMTGKEYVHRNDLHPFWDFSRGPNVEDVSDAFEQGKAEAHKELLEKAWNETDLAQWYIASVDEHEPIWTDKHIEELYQDFILIKK